MLVQYTKRKEEKKPQKNMDTKKIQLGRTDIYMTVVLGRIVWSERIEGWIAKDVTVFAQTMACGRFCISRWDYPLIRGLYVS